MKNYSSTVMKSLGNVVSPQLLLLDRLTTKTAINVSESDFSRVRGPKGLKHLCGRAAVFALAVTTASATSSCGSGNPPGVTKDVTEREKLELAVIKSTQHDIEKTTYKGQRRKIWR